MKTITAYRFHKESIGIIIGKRFEIEINPSSINYTDMVMAYLSQGDKFISKEMHAVIMNGQADPSFLIDSETNRDL